MAIVIDKDKVIVDETKIKHEQSSTELQGYIEQAQTLLQCSISIDQTQASHLAWHSLISILAEHYATITGKQLKPSKETATLLLKLRLLIRKVACDCPMETVRMVPDTGIFASKTLLYYFVEHDLFKGVGAIRIPFMNRLSLADLNWQHKETGNTALMLAARSDSHKVVRCLLCEGAAYDIRNLKDMNAYEIAPSDAFSKRILIWTERLFGLAEGRASYNSSELITDVNVFDGILGEAQLGGGQIDFRNYKGETPYDVAIAKGKLTLEMIKKLEVTRKPGFDADDEEGYQRWAERNINKKPTALPATTPAVGTAEPLLYFAPHVLSDAPMEQEATSKPIAWFQIK